MDRASSGLWVVFVSGLLLLWHPSAAPAAFSVSFFDGVDTLVIGDNDGDDLDPRVGVISFDLFALRPGYQLLGTATQGSNGVLVIGGQSRFADFAQVSLDLQATRPGNVGNGGRLLVSFEGVFAPVLSPRSPAFGSDVILGDFVNTLGNNLGAGNLVRSRGFVNNMVIDPLLSSGNNEAFEFTPMNNLVGQPFGPDGHGPKEFMFMPDTSSLMGRVAFNLGPNNRLGLRSQVILVAPDPAAVPEPGPLALVAGAGLSLCVRGLGRR
jgi:hypothetical protein